MFKKGRYVRYCLRPDAGVLLDAPHASSPGADVGTGEIVEAASEKAGCHAVVALVSRKTADLNRAPVPTSLSAVTEYRGVLAKAVSSSPLDGEGRLIVHFLHVGVHGMRDDHGYDIEFGTRWGKTCAGTVASWLGGIAGNWARGLPCEPPRIVWDRKFVGDPVQEVHRAGSQTGAYGGFGPRHHAVQVEFARWLRDKHRPELIDLLSRIAQGFQQRFGLTQA